MQVFHICGYELSLHTYPPSPSIFLGGGVIFFFAAVLIFLGQILVPLFFNRLNPVDDPMFNVLTFLTPLEVHLIGTLSPMLTTIEDIFLCIASLLTLYRPLFRDLEYWREFFGEFLSVL